MILTQMPIGATITVCHRYLVAETGYWSWETEVITGVIQKHYPNSILLKSEGRLVFCDNDKDELIN